jgi:NAD(P)H-hydrate epimerase
MIEMNTITSSEMAAVDTNCEYHGLSRLQLMENAGRGLADEISKRFDGGKITILAGTGNNGGDSFVAARFLKNFDIHIILLGRERDMRTEIARRNFSILKKSGYSISEEHFISEIDGDIVVDAMLGTGVRGDLREPFKSAVRCVNSSKAFVISVDVPTGLNPDTGEYKTCVKADLTVTFHRNKPGLLKAREVAGEVVVRDIGITEYYEKLCGPGDVQKVYRRMRDAHKGMHGRVLVVGGGAFTGAPALTAISALRAGADIVTLAVPGSIYEIAASFSPDLIVRRLEGYRITDEDIPELEKLADRHDVVVMGMGTGDRDFRYVVESFLESGKVKKAVLDAEGITSEIPEGVECILTPHGGEFRRVFGIEPEENNVLKAARDSNSVILLKSERDIITDGERMRINTSGNPGMTVGGTGDVLAGIVGALFCMGDALWSASAGAFINGFAGDLCLQEMGYGFTAMDVSARIPLAIKKSLEFGR